MLKFRFINIVLGIFFNESFARKARVSTLHGDIFFKQSSGFKMPYRIHP